MRRLGRRGVGKRSARSVCRTFWRLRFLRERLRRLAVVGWLMGPPVKKGHAPAHAVALLHDRHHRNDLSALQLAGLGLQRQRSDHGLRVNGRTRDPLDSRVAPCNIANQSTEATKFREEFREPFLCDK